MTDPGSAFTHMVDVRGAWIPYVRQVLPELEKLHPGWLFDCVGDLVPESRIKVVSPVQVSAEEVRSVVWSALDAAWLDRPSDVLGPLKPG